MESFMDVIKTGKIAVLKGSDPKGIFAFTRMQIMHNFSDCYTSFIEGNAYLDEMDIRMMIMEDDTEIILLNATNCDDNVFPYLETLVNKIGIIVCVDELRDIMSKDNFVVYEVDDKGELGRAFTGKDN